MSKKNKNKNKYTQQTNQPIRNSQETKPILTDEQKMEIEIKNEETLKQVESQQIQLAEKLSPESEVKLKDAEIKDDLSKYWTYVKEINRRYETLINLTEDEKNRTIKIKNDLESSKREADLKKTEYFRKMEEINKKEKEILEREFSLDNGEYTGVIRRLLETIKDTEKKVFIDTENLLKELSDFHKNNLNELIDQQKQNVEFEKQFTDLKRDKKKFEIEKKIFEEELKDNYESKYSEQLNLKISELGRLQRKTNNLDTDNCNLRQLFEDLQSAFESTDPQEILRKYSHLSKELKELRTELNERPEIFELDTKQAKIEELQAKVTEYQSKINEGELLELKRILNNMDTYVIEINAYKNQIESAKVREVSLKKTIEDLSVTIDQLKGESSQKADAFEFAKKCDADTLNLGINHLEKKKNQPKNLVELVNYVQQWMSYNLDKPFYYSTETIRIFLAGLNMSPISILQGISGTGKTSLPREFAKALVSESYYLGIDKENRNNSPYRICAVQSGWRDNMDIMGYYNSFEHKYKETDFFKAIYLANQPKYCDTLFLIILDEMNLSRPEHYFADFLSLLEQSPTERFINLSNTPEEVLPNLIKGGNLKIPSNVRFIGTANHDETTLEFAPKTYDRSNLMEMPKNHPGKPKIEQGKESYNIKYSWLSSKFLEAEKSHKDLCEKFHAFINSVEMNLLLIEKGIGIGNRLEFQAEKFISVFVASGNKKEKDVAVAADHLVTSRLFRTLKNRFDLDKTNLTKFKEDYIELFKKNFNFNPTFAEELLNNEISKK